jgi:hypothetical protein
MHRSNPLRCSINLVGADEQYWDIEAKRRHATRVREGVELAAPGNVVLSSGPEMDLC